MQVTYTVTVEMAAARPLAAVRRRVRAGQVGSAWGPALDQVWAFLRRHDGLRTDGHNIFVYHPARIVGDPMEVDFGVQVAGPFEGEGEVVFTHTPGGLVASTWHLGPIERLSEAYGAIEAWRAADGRAFAGATWEIYGDPTDDPDVMEVQIVFLLAPIGQPVAGVGAPRPR